MALNCKRGDLAVVIGDEPGCEDNIGRIVRVLWRTTVDGYPGNWWSIEPIDGQPYTVADPIENGVGFEINQTTARVCIEDRYLRPLRDPKDDTTGIEQSGVERPAAARLPKRMTTHRQ